MAGIDAVTNVLAYLCGTRPGTDLARVDAEAYRIALEPVPNALLKEAALVASRQTGDFLPSAGTLVQIALDLADRELPEADAWELVRKIACGGQAELPPRAAEALRAIGGPKGWPADMGIKRAQFAKAYEAARLEWRRRAALPEMNLLPLKEGKKG